jgi:hypothetical protein
MATCSWLPSTLPGTLIRRSGKNIASIVASTDFGRAKKTRLAASCTSSGGAEHARWLFHYEGSGDNDEAGYRFGAHAFKLGEYVSIRDHHDEIHTFKVASVEPARN